MEIHKARGCIGIRWQVACSFLMSWFYPIVSGQLHYSIFEEMRTGSAIGNLAKDLGINMKDISTRKLRIHNRVSEKYFNVDLENGNLYIADRIDREALCGDAGDCFLTFDAVVENPLNVFNVRVDIKDINDNPPRFISERIELELSEHTLPGTKFILLNAEDLDIGINSLQNYRLSANQHFELGEKKNADGTIFPELILNTALDREEQTNHELILTAFDGGNPMQRGTAVINIVVTDFNDNFPIFTQEVYKVSIKENIQLNSTILQVNASDKDEGINAQIIYSFTTAKTILRAFTINPTNGEIKNKGTLDFEETKLYEFSVQAKDGGGLAAHAKVIIQILDENDNAPEISITSLTSPVPEDSAPGTVVALIEVHDLDSDENGEVDCEIISDVPFKLVSSSNNFFKIVTISYIDREQMPSFNVTVQASDKGSPPLSSRKSIRLEISDINDNAPVFQKMAYIVYVPENNLPGVSIYSVQAIDPDTNENGKVTYSIVNNSTVEHPMSSYISINPVTGVVYAQRVFDYEQQNEFQVEITARDNGSPSQNSSTMLKICIVDQNDNAPKFLFPSSESDGSPTYELVSLSSEKGTLVTKVVAVDEDSGHNAWLSYHFLQVLEPAYFVIDQHTGEIRTTRFFQERDVLRHLVVVIVKDNGTPRLSSSVTLNLIVADSFQQVLPELSSQPNKSNSKSTLQMYLVIALALISFLFLLIVMIAIISKYKESRSTTVLGSMSTNLYRPVDPRFLSKFNDGTLPLPYSYDMCVTLDSSERDFAFLKPHQNDPVQSLLDADDSGIGNENAENVQPSSGLTQVSLYNNKR